MDKNVIQKMINKMVNPINKNQIAPVKRNPLKSIAWISLSFTLGFGSFASAKWAQNDFWMISHPDSLSIVLSSSNTQLAKICKDFQEQVDTVENPRVADAELLDWMRKDSGDDNGGVFTAQFLLNDKRTQEVLKLLMDSANLAPAPNAPVGHNFVQTVKQAQLDYSKLVIKNRSSRAGSFSEKMQKLGLKPMPFKWKPQEALSVLEVQGKDQACDLLNGKLDISGSVDAIFRIGLEDQLSLQKYYSSLEGLITNSQFENQPLFLKSALIGYRFGRFLEQQNLSDEVVPTQLSLLLRRIYDADLNVKPQFLDHDGKPHFEVLGAMRASSLAVSILGVKP